MIFRLQFGAYLKQREAESKSWIRSKTKLFLGSANRWLDPKPSHITREDVERGVLT
jgi:hypothetical protein